MNFALYVTTKCNLACTYCYQEENGYNADAPFCGRSNMSMEVAKAALDLSVRNKSASTGFCIYGGEPLLCKDMIREFVEYCRDNKPEGHIMRYKLVTNGVLMDEDFVKFATENEIGIALSHDGLMQDDCRVFANGKGTFDLLSDKIDLLLKYQPKAVSMTTVDPKCVTKLADSIKYLHDKGFKVFIIAPRLARECVWDDDSLELLTKEYEKLAEMYLEWTLNDEEFFFAPFDSKISVHINGDARMRHTCDIGDKQPSILPDGRIYPCQQFIEEQFCIGNVFDGIDARKMVEIRKLRNKKPTICADCDYREQCRYTCCCANYQCTGRVDEISPFQCEYERLMIDNANRVASILYEKRSESFVKKQYKLSLSQLTDGIVT